jgi:putative SOS response-associated peptidase YedK
MCGRFTLKTPPLEWGQFLLPLVQSEHQHIDPWQPRFNIAPSQSVVAVVASSATSAGVHAPGRHLQRLRWGLIPAWAAEPGIGNSMINARSESIHEKRSFKGAFLKRRCLVVADGYYEWRSAGAGLKKQPVWIHQPGEQIFLMAGIWETNCKATGDRIDSCAIITTQASEDVRQVHDRMPVVLDGTLAERWLEPDHSIDELREYLAAPPKGTLTFRPVNSVVNNARNEGPQCLGGPA